MLIGVTLSGDNGDNSQVLTPQQAAALLGINWRTVRRWIDNGKLEGTRHPCTTTRAAVEAYKAAQQPKTGEVLSAAQSTGTEPDNAASVLWGIVMALSGRLSEATMTIERLAREVGRLEAELAQCRREAGGGRRENERRIGVLGRMGPWLRTRG